MFAVAASKWSVMTSGKTDDPEKNSLYFGDKHAGFFLQLTTQFLPKQCDVHSYTKLKTEHGLPPIFSLFRFCSLLGMLRKMLVE
jgi:hypothetical protein